MKKILFALLFAVTGFISAFAESEDWFTEKFPAKLINAKGKEVDAATALKGKFVAVYFSASWCGPCRGFTPKLIDFYKSVAKKENVEIIFASLDKEDKAMMDYMKKYKMPWLAIHFDAEERTNLQKTLKVSGIPQLVVFDSEGKMISPNARWDVVVLGRKAVAAWKDPEYKPKTYQDYNKQSKKDSSSKSRKNKKSGNNKYPIFKNNKLFFIVFAADGLKNVKPSAFF